MAHPNGDLAKLKLDYNRARADLLDARERCRRLRAALVALVGDSRWWRRAPLQLPAELRDLMASRALSGEDVAAALGCSLAAVYRLARAAGLKLPRGRRSGVRERGKVERDRAIRAALAAGRSVRDVATVHHLSAERVRQIGRAG